jgi:hypothetical protein
MAKFKYTEPMHGIKYTNAGYFDIKRFFSPKQQ